MKLTRQTFGPACALLLCLAPMTGGAATYYVDNVGGADGNNGTNGYAGNWSMSVSTNLTDWSVLSSKTIPRSPSGTNTWVHTNGINPAKTLFYRPCVE